MENNRRNFLKLTGLAGIGLIGSKFSQADSPEFSEKRKSSQFPVQRFNMSGYAAPKLDKVRIGFIGLGNRGPGAVDRMSHIECVEIKGLCDIRTERTDLIKAKLNGSIHNPDCYSGEEDSWKKLCEREDVDLIYITTPWNLHTPMAVYAMNHGKHVCTEVPAAITLEECWQLVEASERNKRHCMMLENCCYDFFELLTLNMARQGYFGEIIHGEGAYIHDLLEGNFSKTKYYKQWRLKENFRNGNLYPTHGLGPICQIMDINRGDQMDFLVSVQSNDFMMAEAARELAAKDDFYKELATKTYRGNMNTTTIKTIKGKTILLQHDVSSTRPYSRLHLVSGTKCVASKYPEPAKISKGHEWLSEDEMKKLEETFAPPIIKRIGEMAKKVGGHGGMDFMMDWRTIDCLRNGLPLDQDVYDAALWSSIAPLSELSVSNRSQSVDVPDFTCGSWKNNQKVDISLQYGGNTLVI